MKHYTVSIPDEKDSLFQELSKALGFKFDESTNDIPDWHKEIIDQRLMDFEKNPSKVIPWADVKKNLFSRLK